MRIGVVVDGISEFASLGQLYPGLQLLSGAQLLQPVKADIQPYAPVGVIVRQCAPKVALFLARGADRVVVLIDREDRDSCAGTLATAIEQGIASRGHANVYVVLKSRAFENWVIADLAALRALPKRFVVSRATERAVQPNKADHVDAIGLLKRSAQGDAYDKVKDSKSVLGKAEPDRIGQHSRSFRRFMHVVGCPKYELQSRLPA
jgi:uncharacterized protein DUF4276